MLPLLAALSLAAAPPARPNVVVLFADDFTHEAVRSLGQLDVDTPNLDRLAARGTAFRRAYNQGSWVPAVCVASRAMLMTGRRLWDAEKVAGAPAMRAEVAAGRLWPQLMKAAGYRTAMTGKWHVNADASKVFDAAKNVRAGMPRDGNDSYNRPPPAGAPDPWDPADPSRGGFWQGGKHWTEVTADDAVGFVRELAPKPEPFFLYAAFNAPHDPRQSPREYLDRYPLERIRVPASFRPLYEHAEAMAADDALRDERLAPFPRRPEAVKLHRREYFALITHLDHHVGRVLDAVDQSGEAENTVVVFSADHGLACGAHGLMGKQNLYEHSLRAPLIVAGPGAPAGLRVDAPVDIQDMMPTALELAGAAKPAHVAFRSLLPLLRGDADRAADRVVVAAYLDRQRAIIDGGWKLIWYPKDGGERLYHVSADPEELRDLAADPAHAAREAALRAKLRERMAEWGDKLAGPRE